MKIKNVSVETLHISDLVDETGHKGITLDPSDELTIFDELAERSTSLAAWITAGKISVINEFVEPNETPGLDPLNTIADLGVKVIAWIIHNDYKFDFTNSSNVVTNVFTGDVSGSVLLNVAVVNSSNVVDTFNSISTVTVTADKGTINSAANLIVTMTDGIATISVSDNLAETVVLSLSGGNTSLNLDATAQVTFS